MTDRYYRPPTWVRVRLVNPLFRALAAAMTGASHSAEKALRLDRPHPLRRS